MEQFLKIFVCFLFIDLFKVIFCILIGVLKCCLHLAKVEMAIICVKYIVYISCNSQRSRASFRVIETG
jgi:hypothetical protein